MPSPTLELLDLVRKNNGNCSDYRVAQLLGVNRQAVSKWRRSTVAMSDETAHQAAVLAGEDPVLWLVKIAAERAATPDQAAAWRSVLARLKGAATLAAFTLLIIALPNRLLASELTHYGNGLNIHYAN